MKNPPFFFLLILFFAMTTNAQEIQYTTLTIPDNLKENANACVRLNNVEITINSRKSMTIKTTRVVSVLNEYGLKHIGAREYNKVKVAEAVVYNSFGKEIKKIRKKDFKEILVSEGSIITDNKMFYLDYTPTEYPFTIVYTSETETSNTAFIPTWSPFEDVLASVEKTSVKINFLSDLGFKYKEFNFGNQVIDKVETANNITFSAENVTAIRNEDYSPFYTKFIPYVMFGLDNFYLEGVEGTAKTWKEFGQWMNTNLLEGTNEISPETQAKIKALVGDEKDPIKISKIVYQYVQGKTRYVSIQLGIGGWKPMLAKDVDRLGYGDCKALTNYTRALLKVVGVPSYYTIVYGDYQKRDLNTEFVSIQGNHVILGIPVNEQIYWLECTSQIHPFGFQGEFTDDRKVLIITPEGGKIVKTKEYVANENTQITSGSYVLTSDGSISGKLVIKSKGTQYDDKFSRERSSNEDLTKFYKDYFGHINNLKLTKINLTNNKDEVEFAEEIALEANQYANPTGGRLMFAVNAFNQSTRIPQRYRNRNNPFEIQRGFYDEDEVAITLPEGFKIEAKPENFELKETYGHYKTEYKILDESHVLYKRSLLINGGEYPNTEYEKYRKFREQIAKNDNAKFVLVKS